MYKTVMAYLDNLIAWGDSLFRQDTGEAIDEAMMLYVLAANILGPQTATGTEEGFGAPADLRQPEERPKAVGTVMREWRRTALRPDAVSRRGRRGDDDRR